MDSPVEEIRRRLDIVDFIGSFLTLKRSGRNFKALCPFHQEKTPSFVVSPERQIWHCFGACGEGGDIIKFFVKWENITFFEALKELSKKAGIKLKKINFDDEAWKRKERLIYINNLAKDFFQYLLHNVSIGKKALEYLMGREINRGTINKFELGYAPLSWDSILKFLKRKKIEEEEMLEVGLLVRNERGRFYDRFRGRIMFPIKDVRSNILGFSGRLLDDKQKEAKYINTPETPLYHKRETFFGFYLAKEKIKKENKAIVVEGEFDMIAPYQFGIENIVAIKGSALTREQLMIIKRYTNRIDLALDTDKAGEEAIKRGIEEAEALDFEIGIINFNYAKDPDEATRKDITAFKKAIKQSIPIYDFIINSFQKKFAGDDPFNKKNFAENCVPYISRIKNPIVKSYYIKKLVKLLDVSERSVEQLLRQYQFKTNKNIFVSAKIEGKKQRREIILQKYLLSLIFQATNPYAIADRIFHLLTREDFSIPAYGLIFQLLSQIKQKHPTFSLKIFTGQLPAQLKPVFDELYLFATIEQEAEFESIEKLAYEIKKCSLKNQINNISSSAEFLDKGKERLLCTLSQEIKDIEKLMLTL